MLARSILSWRSTCLFGVCLIALGLAYFFFDEVTVDRFGSSSVLTVFAYAGLVGVLLASIGLIGWAKQFGRKKRLQMAASVFFAPWIAVFFAYLVDDLNMHGSAGLVFLLLLFAIILTMILLIMAATAKYA
jgi:ABC-type transport system involved in cytochrome c biogenesis permease subunit